MNQIKFTIDAGQLFSKSVSTGCNKPVCTCSTLWRQHYITTSKEYLTVSYILSKYFELVFPQLHLIKILCNCSSFDWIMKERKRVPFYETTCICANPWEFLGVKYTTVQFRFLEIGLISGHQNWCFFLLPFKVARNLPSMPYKFHRFMAPLGIRE